MIVDKKGKIVISQPFEEKLDLKDGDRLPS